MMKTISKNSDDVWGNDVTASVTPRHRPELKVLVGADGMSGFILFW